MGLDRTIDITAEQRKIVLALIESHLPHTTAWVYGSRAKWTARPQSDLDLVVFATPDQSGRVSDLREAFEESNLPFRVDLFVWNDVPEQFRKHINRDHVVLMEKIALGNAGDGWVSLRLGDVCTKIGSGATPRGGKEVYLKDGPCTLIRSQNVYKHRFNHDGLAFISQQQATALNNVEVFADDVLLNITGDSVARACQVETDVLPARVSQHVAIIRPDSRKLSARFLRYFLVSPKTQTVLLSWAGSGGTRNALTKDMIESFEVRAPADVAEQRDIAYILGTLDDKIELNRRMNETLEAMARAVFKSWFVDFDPVCAKMDGRDTGLPKDTADVFPDRLVDSELGEIPEGWTVRTLGDLCHKPQYGYTAAAKSLPVGPRFLRITDINKESWTTWSRVPFCEATDDEFLKYRLSKGEVLIARMADPGHGILVEEDVEAVFASYLIRFKPVESRHARLLQYWLKSDAYWQLVRGQAAGTTRVSLNAKVLSLFSLVVPPDAVASAFAVLVGALRDRLVKNATEMQLLAVLRDTLLPKLVSGELRVNARVPTCGREGRPASVEVHGA